MTQQALDAVAQKANSSESNSSTENALNPKINAGKMTTATNEDDKSLQQNVKLIKQLYIVRKLYFIQARDFYTHDRPSRIFVQH